MKNPLNLLNEASLAKEITTVDGYEKFLNPNLYKNDLIESLDHILFVIDFRTQKIIHLSKNAQDICGYSHTEILKKGTMFMFDMMHPSDIELLNKNVFSSFIGFCAEYDFNNKDLSKFKFSYTGRLIQKDGTHKFVLNRYRNMVTGENGIPLVIIGTTSDISNVSESKEIIGEIVEEKDGKSPKVLLKRSFSIQEKSGDHTLSKKEFEVLKLVTEGFISKEIAALTSRSIQTIHTHRKNIMKKLNCKSFTDVVVIAKKNNWV